MIPRFSNPHFLPDFTKTVSRSQIYLIEGEDTEACFKEDPNTIAHLNALLSKSIAIVQHEPNGVPPVRKKRKILSSENTQDTPPKEPILCRLVSSTLPPLPVSLLPPPPPPPITREPDAEDTEIQARLRKQFAESVAVDSGLILRESLQPIRGSRSKVITIHSKLEEPSPRIMIVQTLQSPRKSRPPVLSSNIKQYPYVSDPLSMKVETAGLKIGNLLTVDAQHEDESATNPRKRNRRRRKKVIKERPIPEFWRPSSTLNGKSRGYAYGYPSYLASGMGSLRKKYCRDSMKKGVLSLHSSE